MNYMKSLTSGIVFLIILSQVSLSAGAQSSNQVEGELMALVSQEWAAYQEKLSVHEGGIAVYLLTPEKSFFAATGMQEDVDQHIHFRGASTTKTFTAASIMFMHQEGLLDIEDSIVDTIPGTTQPYLPDTAEYDIPYKNLITIRQLLGHRAGVFDVSNDDIPENAEASYAGRRYTEYVRQKSGEDHTFTFDELVGVVAENNLSYWEPGEGFHYSNTGYSMLGKIIERVSGMTYREYVETTFVKPLGLSGTSFPSQGDEMTLPSPYATGYIFYGGKVYETTEDNMSQAVAEGNIITTPRDLATWITLLRSGNAGLAPGTVAMMSDVTQTGEFHVWYGLGITYTEGLGYGHNGAHAGYMTVVRYDPDDEVTVMVFSSLLNAEDVWGQGAFKVELAQKARGIAGF